MLNVYPLPSDCTIVRVFATTIYFHPCLTFVSRAKNLPLKWSLKRVSTLVAFLACLQMLPRVKVNGSGKHSNLLQYGNNYSRIKFYSTGPRCFALRGGFVEHLSQT
jgi:hypothetical protein